MRSPALLVLIAGLLAGCAQPAPAGNAEPAPDHVTDAASLRPIEKTFGGSALATPVQPYNMSFAFDVPDGAVGVNGTLTWSDPTARLALALEDPRGDIVARGYPASQGTLIVVTVEPPRGGTWKFIVTSELAANVPFSLKAVAELIVPDDNVVAKRFTMGPRGFYEANVIMEKDATFRFAFNATGPLAWNVHSHPPEGLKEWQKGVGDRVTGAFTAPERDIYSLLLQTEATQAPTDVDVALEGKFRLHSHG